MHLEGAAVSPARILGPRRVADLDDLDRDLVVILAHAKRVGPEALGGAQRVDAGLVAHGRELLAERGLRADASFVLFGERRERFLKGLERGVDVLAIRRVHGLADGFELLLFLLAALDALHADAAAAVHGRYALGDARAD